MHNHSNPSYTLHSNLLKIQAPSAEALGAIKVFCQNKNLKIPWKVQEVKEWVQISTHSPTWVWLMLMLKCRLLIRVSRSLQLYEVVAMQCTAACANSQPSLTLSPKSDASFPHILKMPSCFMPTRKFTAFSHASFSKALDF